MESKDSTTPFNYNIMEIDQPTPAVKMERSYEKETSLALVEADSFANSSDVQSNTAILLKIIELCFNKKDWQALREQLETLSVNHGHLDLAVTEMTKKAIEYIDFTPDIDTKIEYIITLRKITEGKMLVERERAKLTRQLSSIYEEQGKIELASDTIQEDQIETFGSLDKRTKVEFILEQMRLCLLLKDFVRMAIVSKKININYFADDSTVDLKLRYYELMIEHDIHEQNYLQVSRHFHKLFLTKEIKEDESRWPDIMVKMVLFCVLAKYNNEQLEMMHLISKIEELEKLPLVESLLKQFISNKLIVWDEIPSRYEEPLFKKLELFNEGTEAGKVLRESLRERVTEHNIQVISKYYSRINMVRLSQLIGLDMEKSEEKLCSLIVDKSIYARINRPKGIVEFIPIKSVHETLDLWVSDVNNLFDLVEKTTHLIEKENVIHKISRTY
ncbi:26S proteasome non-ATPase regulatory subunit 12 [Smittium mucronatum]|uniref:26S proteasome non-ATPase regulatory subunit 12 n=1 Tax=Smittium mucronatum TaxID=133383 RepID=A0A1R0H2I1_9FUNG|nr:26S proteasome non-ATPase regulatory subunit 12 [Smittium mucronatum]